MDLKQISSMLTASGQQHVLVVAEENGTVTVELRGSSKGIGKTFKAYYENPETGKQATLEGKIERTGVPGATRIGHFKIPEGKAINLFKIDTFEGKALISTHSETHNTWKLIGGCHSTHCNPEDHKATASTSHGATTKRFLDMLDSKTRAEILANIAKHYGFTPEAAYQEVIDEDAESLLDYITGPMRDATSLLMKRNRVTADAEVDVKPVVDYARKLIAAQFGDVPVSTVKPPKGELSKSQDHWYFTFELPGYRNLLLSFDFRGQNFPGSPIATTVVHTDDYRVEKKLVIPMPRPWEHVQDIATGTDYRKFLHSHIGWALRATQELEKQGVKNL